VTDDWTPAGIDVTTPNVARMYDFFLGGKDNFAADRTAAEKILQLVPEVPQVVRENRAFLVRAVRYLRAAGIDQFIDIGTGLPTQNAVHEVAGPDAKVVYVDSDPVVLAHGRALLGGLSNVEVIQGDLRKPAAIMADPRLRQIIDLDRPVAVLLLAILHFIPDSDDPAGIVGTLREALAPGSHLVLTHATQAGSRREDVPKVTGVYEQSTAPVTLREYDEVRPLFDGFELVKPGLVYVSQWPEPGGVHDPDVSRAFGGVAILR
jgi:SAM-dependent methyltransferase